jgi:hypothetical protein
VLTNKGFIKWATEHVVVLISHNELGHDAIEEKGEDGETTERCPLYPGMTCRQHLDVSVQTDNSRDETQPVVPFIELHPNSWLIAPDDRVHRIEETDQFAASAIKKQTAALQKELGETLTHKAFEAVLPHVRAAHKAMDTEVWVEALKAWATVREQIKNPGKGLLALIQRHFDEITEDVDYVFEEAREGDAPLAERRKIVRALLDSVDVKVAGKYLPIHEQLGTWLQGTGVSKGGK